MQEIIRYDILTNVKQTDKIFVTLKYILKIVSYDILILIGICYIIIKVTERNIELHQ